MTVTDSRLPNCAWKPISYRGEAGKFEHEPLGWILHTQDGNGPLFNFFNGLRSPNRKFSTAWVGKDGKGEQYTELGNKSWANSTSGNGKYWSIETEGKIGEPLTSAQIETLALWHHFLDCDDKLALKDGDKGIGIHSMLFNTACPGKIRAEQRSVIIKTRKPLTKPPTVYTQPHAPTFPYSPSNYFGVVNPDKYCHSGTFSATDRKYIRVFQQKMYDRGWKTMDIDGIYGPETKSIISKFQSEKHLVVSGRVGTQTWKGIWEKSL